MGRTLSSRLFVALVSISLFGCASEPMTAGERIDYSAARGDYNVGLTAFESGDYKTALEKFRPLAEKGFAPAQYQLGLMHSSGRGVPPNLAKAAELYRNAAEQGYAPAQASLASIYSLRGDHAKAAEWYRKAAEQGVPYAQSSLGYLYEYGSGVPQNSAKAVTWYRKAAEQGYAPAQDSLGGMYRDGQGVPKDLVQAHMWLNLAKRQEHDNAWWIAQLEKDMTAEQIAEAKRLAQEWKPKKQ